MTRRFTGWPSLTHEAVGVAMRSTLLSFLCAVLVLSSPGSAQTTGSTQLVIPAKVYNGYLVVVQGSIGGMGKKNFAIDTGAYPSIIDRSIAKKLHLVARNEELRVVDHNINSQATFVPSLSLGPIRATNLKVLMQDLTPISETFGVHLDALIGLDILANSSFRIDYREKKVVFGPVDPLPMSAPMRWTDSMACVDLKVNDQPARLVVDTAAASSMLFTQRLPWASAGSGDPHGYSNLGGGFTLHDIKAHSLELGGNDLGAGQVFISNAKNLTPFHFDGLLATGSLPFRQIAFDFERQLLAWEPAGTRADRIRVLNSTALRPALTSPPPTPQIGMAGACATMGMGCGGPGPLRIHSAR